MALILIADDEPSVRDVLAQICELDGHSPLLAADPVEALALSDESPPDLVIADLSMPEGGGSVLLHGIRTTSRGALCPVIVISGTVHQESDDDELLDAAHAVFAKPFNVADVRAAIQGALATADQTAH